MTKTPTAPTLPLLGGGAIPQLGLGTWPMTDDDAERALPSAVELGYRLFDTAFNYKNESGLGRAIAAVRDVPREELFITSKFNAEWHGVDLVRDAWRGSVERLGLEYLDLFLIHWPNPAQDRYVDAWRGLVKLREEGLVRSIGVSNFKLAHLERMLDETGAAPEVNQVQLSPYATRADLRAFHATHGIMTESWAPIGQGKELLDEPVVTAIAARLGRTPAQVVLRWHVELGLVAIPKTNSPARMAENLDVFDFELTADDVSAITSLDRGDGGLYLDADSFGH